MKKPEIYQRYALGENQRRLVKEIIKEQIETDRNSGFKVLRETLDGLTEKGELTKEEAEAIWKDIREENLTGKNLTQTATQAIQTDHSSNRLFSRRGFLRLAAATGVVAGIGKGFLMIADARTDVKKTPTIEEIVWKENEPLLAKQAHKQALRVKKDIDGKRKDVEEFYGIHLNIHIRPYLGSYSGLQEGDIEGSDKVLRIQKPDFLDENHFLVYDQPFSSIPDSENEILSSPLEKPTYNTDNTIPVYRSPICRGSMAGEHTLMSKEDIHAGSMSVVFGQDFIVTNNPPAALISYKNIPVPGKMSSAVRVSHREVPLGYDTEIKYLRGDYSSKFKGHVLKDDKGRYITYYYGYNGRYPLKDGEEPYYQLSGGEIKGGLWCVLINDQGQYVDVNNQPLANDEKPYYVPGVYMKRRFFIEKIAHLSRYSYYFNNHKFWDSFPDAK